MTETNYRLSSQPSDWTTWFDPHTTIPLTGTFPWQFAFLPDKRTQSNSVCDDQSRLVQSRDQDMWRSDKTRSVTWLGRTIRRFSCHVTSQGKESERRSSPYIVWVLKVRPVRWPTPGHIPTQSTTTFLNYNSHIIELRSWSSNLSYLGVQCPIDHCNFPISSDREL